MARIVVAGGGICGLAGAQMLADDGHQVTVIERDAAGVPSELGAAFHWDRRSVAQFELGHLMLPRGSAILRDEVPAAHQALADNGGLTLNFAKYLLGLQGVDVVAEDDRFDMLTGRRSTIEWALGAAADAHPNVEVRRGDGIAGLLAESDAAVPHVTGVRLSSGEEVMADLVVDATGRRSPTPTWLGAIGARPPVEESEDSGFAYYCRYFSSDDGRTPAIFAPLLTAIGSFSVLTLPADNGTWSVILYALSDDKPLRSFRDPEVFERVLRSCPLHAHWHDGEPLTDVMSMVGPVDRDRSFVVDGMPCATGLATVGDAASCTNPSLGRGMSLGLMHAQILREVVRDHADDPVALALALHERSRAEVHPYHEATVAVDRRRVRDMRVYRDGGVPEPTPEERIADAIGANAVSDPVAARTFAEIMGCTALPEEVLARPGVLEHVIALSEGSPAAPAPGPSRDDLVALAT